MKITVKHVCTSCVMKHHATIEERTHSTCVAARNAIVDFGPT